jgi:ankyrin repeat protein
MVRLSQILAAFFAILLLAIASVASTSKTHPATVNAHTSALLLQAARNGDTAGAKKAIAQGADVNFRDSSGSTPLMLAARYGHEAVVKLLLAQKADSAIKRKDNETALSLAIGSGYPSVAREIASTQSDFVAEFEPGTSLLGWAATWDDLAAVKACFGHKVDLSGSSQAEALGIAAAQGLSDIANYLLKNGTDVNGSFGHGTTPLMFAAMSSYPGATGMLDQLLKAGAKVDDEDADGKTALLWAATGANLESIKILIAHGADINHRDKSGKTASQLADESGANTAGAIDALLQRAATNTMDSGDRLGLVAAEESGDLSKLQSLLAAGGDVNARDDAGDTLLMIAAKQGRLPIVEMLIKNKADIEATSLSYWHYTALAYACDIGNLGIIEALLDAGADPNRAISEGYMPMDRVIMSMAPDALACVKALFAHGAKMDVTDNNGDSPLIDAANYGETDVVKLLLDKGAKIDARDTDGGTALSAAVENCWPDTVRLLIARGANVNLGSGVANTPLAIAEYHLNPIVSGNIPTYKAIISMLKKAGAHQ